MPPSKQKKKGHKFQTQNPQKANRKVPSKSSKKTVNNQTIKGNDVKEQTLSFSEALCRTCNGQFKDMDALLLHQTEKHSKTGNMSSDYDKNWYKCTLCDCTFGMQRSYRLHQLWHSGVQIYSCDICKHHFESLSHLTSHQKIHALPKLHACYICGKTFSKRNIFHVHLNKYHANYMDKEYECEFCGRIFRTHYNMSKHARRHKDRKYECHICHKFFLRRFELQYHHQVHIQDSSEVDVETLTSYKCLFCEASLKLSKMKAHLQLHIGGLIQCRECEEVFSDNALFEQHVENHRILKRNCIQL